MRSARMATPGGAKVPGQASQAPPGGAHGSVAQTHRVYQLQTTATSIGCEGHQLRKVMQPPGATALGSTAQHVTSWHLPVACVSDTGMAWGALILRQKASWGQWLAVGAMKALYNLCVTNSSTPCPYRWGVF
jgi:hypothetical protein